jgi:microcin C transport system substrate-binding protein
MKRNLKKMGINVTIRTVQDDSQYIRRLDKFDFEMVVTNYGSIISPGNEQKNYWSSNTADQPGSPNIIGVKNPVIDEVIENLISSKTREELVMYTRILDRILLFNYYLIPQFHIGHYRVAYWNKLSRPAISPKYDLGFDFWWYDPEKAKRIINIEKPLKNEKNNRGYFYYLFLIVPLVLIWRIRKKMK